MLTEPCGGLYFDGRPVGLVLAPGTASGYKRVKKITDDCFQACRTVGGKQQHVWTSDDPRECAYVLARLELDPCAEEDIKRACKEAAKERTQMRASKRKRAELSRRIHAMHEALIAAPRRAKEAREAAKRARVDQEAGTERVPLSPVKNQ